MSRSSSVSLSSWGGEWGFWKLSGLIHEKFRTHSWLSTCLINPLLFIGNGSKPREVQTVLSWRRIWTVSFGVIKFSHASVLTARWLFIWWWVVPTLASIELLSCVGNISLRLSHAAYLETLLGNYQGCLDHSLFWGHFLDFEEGLRWKRNTYIIIGIFPWGLDNVDPSHLTMPFIGNRRQRK